VQHRDFALGAVDGVVNEVEFDLELFALFDLRAVGFKQRLGLGNLFRHRVADAFHGGAAALRTGHLVADRAQLAHDLAMHRNDVAGVGLGGHRRAAVTDFFNAKTLATNSHRIPPTLNLTTGVNRSV
jgi:hypothetical protein